MKTRVANQTWESKSCASVTLAMISPATGNVPALPGARMAAYWVTLPHARVSVQTHLWHSKY